MVEGQTEFAALPMLAAKVSTCPPLKAINLGGVGSDVEPTAIAKRVLRKVIEHQVAERSPIVVCIDRESRDMTAAALANGIAASLADLLREANRSVEGVYVLAADRTFEAWLLADARGLHARGVFQARPTFHSFEGSMGRSRQKGLLELGTLLGREYRKTTDGPTLFGKLDVAAARALPHGSPSFDGFLRTLGV